MKEIKKICDVKVEWINFEFHPETPKEGVLLADRFGKDKIGPMVDKLRSMGEPYGISFADIYFMPNSRIALEASEYARDHGRFDIFHEKVFREHFENLADIGRPEVVLDIAGRSGLDAGDLEESLEKGEYKEKILSIRAQGLKKNVGKTPYFIMEDKYFIERPHFIDDIMSVLNKTGKECGQHG